MRLGNSHARRAKAVFAHIVLSPDRRSLVNLSAAQRGVPPTQVRLPRGPFALCASLAFSRRCKLHIPHSRLSFQLASSQINDTGNELIIAAAAAELARADMGGELLATDDGTYVILSLSCSSSCFSTYYFGLTVHALTKSERVLFECIVVRRKSRNRLELRNREGGVASTL